MDAFVGAAGGARLISQSEAQTTLSETEVINSDEEEHHQNVVQIAKQGSLGTVHTAQASIHGSCWGQKGRGQVPDDCCQRQGEKYYRGVVLCC